MREKKSYIEERALKDLIEIVGEGDSLMIDSGVFREVEIVNDAYHDALEKALAEWVSKNMSLLNLSDRFYKNNTDPRKIAKAFVYDSGIELSYLYYMQTIGHGVTMSDGELDWLFVGAGKTREASEAIRSLGKFLDAKVSRHAYSLESAIREAADVSPRYASKKSSMSRSAMSYADLYKIVEGVVETNAGVDLGQYIDQVEGEWKTIVRINDSYGKALFQSVRDWVKGNKWMLTSKYQRVPDGKIATEIMQLAPEILYKSAGVPSKMIFPRGLQPMMDRETYDSLMSILYQESKTQVSSLTKAIGSLVKTIERSL